MVRSTRRAVVSGTMPMPTLHSTSRHTASKLRNCTRSRSGWPIARRLVGEEALQRAGAVEPDEIVVEHLREGDLRALGERMVARDHQHEAVLAERIGLERARIDGAGDDAEIGDAFGDQADDLVAQPLLEIDADMRMRGQERAQRLGQELGERIGVGQHPDLAGEAAGIGAEVLAQALGLAQDGARVLQQRAAGLGRRARPGGRAPASAAPSASSMLRMRVEAAASARLARSAPCVMLPASTTWRNRLRSARSKRMAAPILRI